MTFLSPEEVGDAFVELMDERPDDPRLTEFCDYLVDVYISENSTFPPGIWAAPIHCSWRTTNGCESFHSRFNASCPSPHPNINVFLKRLQAFQTDTYIKITSTKCNFVINEKKTFVSEKIEQYSRNEIDRRNFVKCVSYNYNKCK